MIKLLFVILLSCCLTIWAAEDVYPFTDATQRAQFTHLTEEIRCLVCQNQSIADSNAPFAADLRQEVYKLVQQNKSNAEIKEYLKKRFGQYVLLNPPITSRTIGLWIAPLGFLAVGFTVLISIVTRQRRLKRVTGELK